MFAPRTRSMAIAAVMIAVTAVFTLLIRIPIPVTGGYFNLSDMAIYFAAFTFGPVIGLVAGGIGAGLADVIGGYAVWAPITLVTKGLQGLVAGAIGHERSPSRLLLGWFCGSCVMVAGYFFGQTFFLMGGLLPTDVEGPISLLQSPALFEVPFNVLQNVLGGLVGIPLYLAVRRAYPPVTRLARPDEWQEG